MSAEAVSRPRAADPRDHRDGARASGRGSRTQQITMAHGAGGKATQTLIEGLLVPAFESDDALAALGDAGARDGRRHRAGADHRQLRRQADPLPRRLDRRAGGQRHGQRPRRGRRAAAGAERSRSILEEGLAADELRAEVEAIAAAAAAAGVEIVAGDTKVVERGHADAMYVCTTGIGPRSTRARALAPDALRPGDRILVSGPIGEHGTAIMLARGEFELDAEIESDTRSLWPAVDALLEAAGPALRCMRDATRGGVASVLNELARASGVAMVVREADVPVQPGGGRRGGAAGDRPDVRGQRGQARGLRGARARRRRRWPRCARCRAARRRRRSAR